MNETNKFKDAYGDSIQACFLSCGVIEINKNMALALFIVGSS